MQVSGVGGASGPPTRTLNKTIIEFYATLSRNQKISKQARVDRATVLVICLVLVFPSGACQALWSPWVGEAADTSLIGLGCGEGGGEEDLHPHPQLNPTMRGSDR